jgi:small-conductance mechanosensitive channel
MGFTSFASSPESAPVSLDQQTILQFLAKAIDWYQHQSLENSSSPSPNDIAFVNENLPGADQIVQLSFEFARAGAQMVRSSSVPAPPTDSRYATLTQLASKLEASSNQTRVELQSLREKLNNANRKERPVLESQIARLNSQSAMMKTQLDSVQGILRFAGASDPDELTPHIDALERSLPKHVASNPVQSAAAPPDQDHSFEPWNIWAVLGRTRRLSNDVRTIGGKIRQTDELLENVQQLGEPLRNQLAALTQQSDRIVSQAGSQDPAVVAQQKATIDALTEQFKLAASASLPLRKEVIVLEVYKKNLASWSNLTKSKYSESVKDLAILLLGLAVFTGVILGVFAVWRAAIFRYIPDLRRRNQFLFLRKIVLWFVIFLITIFSLSRQWGSLATFAGLLTAGVAVALQNVILAVVGYFLLIGKFGVGIGDRVQIAGVTGEVVEIGFMRLHVMELAGTGADAQPTGRMVAFSNSIAFQPNAGLFRQVPGTNFVWRETSLTFAADSDYTVVEQRLLTAIDAAFEDLEEDFAQLGHRMQKSLTSIVVGPLAPRLRFKLTPAGLEAVLRFPVEMSMAEEIDDRVARELVQAINTEPRLKVLAADVPTMQIRAEAPRSRSA